MVQDYSAELDKDLEEQNLYDERGHLNEELLARPDEIIPEDYADPEIDENEPFVAVSFQHCEICLCLLHCKLSRRALLTQARLWMVLCPAEDI